MAVIRIKAKPVMLDWAAGEWYVPDDIEIEAVSLSYPCTIVRDRYTGTYSGGIYTAWPCFPKDVPSAISEDDVTCREYWQGTNAEVWTRYVGRGNTTEEAFKDMQRRLGTV